MKLVDYLEACSVANKMIESAEGMGKMSHEEFVRLIESMPLSDELKKKIIDEQK